MSGIALFEAFRIVRVARTPAALNAARHVLRGDQRLQRLVLLGVGAVMGEGILQVALVKARLQRPSEKGLGCSNFGRSVLSAAILLLPLVANGISRLRARRRVSRFQHAGADGICGDSKRRAVHGHVVPDFRYAGAIAFGTFGVRHAT